MRASHRRRSISNRRPSENGRVGQIDEPRSTHSQRCREADLDVWRGSPLDAFVGVQMRWVLRAFIGQIGEPTTFFRSEAWDNAYVKLVELLLDVLGFR